MWGPPLNQSQLAHLQRLQNSVTKCLRKYDHVLNHRQHLNWLPVSDQIKLVPCFATFIVTLSHAWFLIHQSYLDHNTVITHVARTALLICKLVISQAPKNYFDYLPLLGGILSLLYHLLFTAIKNSYPLPRTFT